MTAVVAPQQGGLWQRRSSVQMPPMSVAGLMPAYDPSRYTPTASNTTPRIYQAPQMDMGSSMFQNTAVSQMQFQSGVFAFDNMAVNPYSVQQPFNMQYQHAPISQPAAYAAPVEVVPVSPVEQHRQQEHMRAMHRSPSVKSEHHSPIQQTPSGGVAGYTDEFRAAPTTDADGNLINFSTDVDTLMKAIQAKTKPAPLPQAAPEVVEVVKPKAPTTNPTPAATSNKSRKRYHCSMPGCEKSFYQKTHLEIHTRAHTGQKPFICKEPSCGQRFSQLGNLKTHERRHTGERPYNCDICGKTFAQRGNVRAHKIVHQQIKPFTCRLDDCGKQFTQLGNLKSHQNKFHAAALRFLTTKFASIQEGDSVSQQDKDLWEYFADLYKNSNKGIKGRGKDRRISTAPSSAASAASSVASLDHHQHPHQMHHHHQQRHRMSMSHSPTSSIEDTYGYGDAVFPERKMY